MACGLAGVVAGCGSAGPAGLSASAAGTLRQQLAKVQAAAGRGDRAGALAALSAFSGDVSRHTGQLTAAQQAALHTGISRLRQRLEATAPATTATTATTPAAPAATTTTTTAPATTTTTTTQPSAPAPAPPTPPAHPGHGQAHAPKGGGPPGHGGHGGDGPSGHGGGG